MTHALITFLGRTPRDPKTQGYRVTTYQFPDGTLEEAAVLGWNLAKRLKPNRVIILGTSGSMWDSWPSLPGSRVSPIWKRIGKLSWRQ